MEFLKDLFGASALTYEELVAKTTENGLNVVDLTQGKYVSKQKHDKLSSQRDALKAKCTELINSIEGEGGLNNRIEELRAALQVKEIALIKAEDKKKQLEELGRALEKDRIKLWILKPNKLARNCHGRKAKTSKQICYLLWSNKCTSKSNRKCTTFQLMKIDR